jgi:hypothetical protein
MKSSVFLGERQVKYSNAQRHWLSITCHNDEVLTLWCINCQLHVGKERPANTGWPSRRPHAKPSANTLMSVSMRLLALIYDPGTSWTGSAPTKHPPLRQSRIRVCLAHLRINCGTHSTPHSTQHWTGLLTCLCWVTNGNPPMLYRTCVLPIATYGNNNPAWAPRLPQILCWTCHWRV